MPADHKLQVVLSAKDITGAAFTRVQTGIRNLSKSVFSLNTAFATLAGAAGIGAVVKSSLGVIDALGKTSEKLGISTQALGALQYAAELTGVSTNNLEMGLQRMTRRVAEAAQGTGEAQKAIKELGLNAEELNQLSPDQMFEEIAEAMRDVESQSDKVRIAFKLFDSGGVDLIRTLELGKRGLHDARKEMELFGTAISRVDYQQVANANDAITKATEATKGLATVLTVELAPYIEDVAKGFADFVKANKELIATNIADTIKNTAEGLKTIYEIYNKLPGWMTAAGGMGLIGGILFRSPQVAALIAGGMGIAGLISDVVEGYEKADTTLGELLKKEENLRRQIASYEQGNMPGKEQWLSRYRSDLEEVLATIEAINKAQTVKPSKLPSINNLSGPPGDLNSWRTLINKELNSANWDYSYDVDYGDTSYAATMRDMRDDMEETTQHTSNQFRLMQDFSRNAAWEMRDSFSHTFHKGFIGELDNLTDHFNNFANGIVRAWSDAVSRMIAEQMAAKLMGNMGGASGGQGGGWFTTIAQAVGTAYAGPVGGMIGGAVASTAGPQVIGLGGRASGGLVSARQSYLVGERGPEILRMGAQGGHITPNHQLGGNVKVVVNEAANSPEQGVTVQENNTGGIRELVVNLVAKEMRKPSSPVGQAIQHTYGNKRVLRSS